MPYSVEYLKDWAVHASIVLTGVGDRPARSAELQWSRYRAAVCRARRRRRNSRGAGDGPFGVRRRSRGWLDQDEAVDLQDGARRRAAPGRPRADAGVDVARLALTDDGFVAHADVLVGVLARQATPWRVEVRARRG